MDDEGDIDFSLDMRYDLWRAQQCAEALQQDLALSFADNDAAVRLMEMKQREVRAEQQREGVAEKLEYARSTQEVRV